MCPGPDESFNNFSFRQRYFSDIWIVGDSLVHWAGERAAALGRQNLCLEKYKLTVKWHGKRGMVWSDLQCQLQWISIQSRCPRMIIIHLAGNDIVHTKRGKMTRMMVRDFKFLFTTFPDTLIIWSEILPRLKWKFAKPDSTDTALGNKRKRFNLLGKQAVRGNLNGRFIKHDVTLDCPGLFGRDGCHLSDVGNDLFCNSLQGAIECFMTTDEKTFGP